MSLPCPCGHSLQNTRLFYKNCCGQYLEHFESTPAPDALSLMRSRYTAFVLEREQYLLDTWCESYRPEHLDFQSGVKWLGLEIRAYRNLNPERAEVEFVARSRLNGRATRLHEVSLFRQEKGRWFYVHGN